MNKKILFFIIGLGLSLFSLDGHTQDAAFDFSKIDVYREAKSKALPVQDLDSVFSEKERKTLSKMLIKYHNKSTNVIVVVTVDSIAPFQDARQMATALGRYWGVGHKEKNNGLIMLLCKPCRSFGIATGDGTRKTLTDSICMKTMEEVIFPQLKKEEYFKGIKEGAETLMQHWDVGN
ncbi:TPM domain-containing protein [Gaetbulibacter sp. M240]|uniref:TPM domain-containing protein n=1 Tax=Gaetbulibacter sp. M240 TaxID=3126511 RepID=UPI00374F12F5